MFPKAKQHTGWKYWMLGMLDYTEIRSDGTIVVHPISPFWLFQDKMLHKTLKTLLLRSIVKIMDSAIVSRESQSLDMTATELEEWYAARTDMIWFQAIYFFVKPKL